MRLALTRGDNDGMGGDSVKAVIDAGDTSCTYQLAATRSGRRVQVTHCSPLRRHRKP